MSTVRKFTFDIDFDAPEEPEVPEEDVEEEPEIVVPTFSEEEMAAERAEGFVEGLEQGRKEAADATEQRLLEAVEKACETLGEIYTHQAEANHEIAGEMISVSTAIAKKMFPDLNARNALGEVERVVQETLKAITEEPRVQIMIHPDLRELLTERLGTMTHRAGFEGKVFVNPDPSLDLGDCRVEWSNGAAIRNSEELWEMIDEIIERNLHGAPDIDEDSDETDASAEQTAETPDEAETDETPSDAAEEALTEAPQPADDVTDMPEPDQATEPEPEPDALETETPDTESISEEQQAMDVSTPGTPFEQETTDLNENQDTQDQTPEEPSFTPSIPIADAPADPESSVSDQILDDDMSNAPVPHLDDEADGMDEAASERSEADEAEEPVRDFDPVSPTTTAAILEAQSELNEDDDEPNPSGG